MIPLIDREPNVVNMKFGSHLYGLDTPDSDVDYKGIYIPTLKELVLGSYPKTYSASTGEVNGKNTCEDIDMEVVSLPQFVAHAIQGETYALDMLHCQRPESSSWIWEELRAHRKKFYSINMKAYMGYVKKQAAKYGLKGSRLADIRLVLEALETLPPNKTIAEVSELLPHGEYCKWVEVQPKKYGMPVQFFYEVNMKKYQSTNTVEYVHTQLEKMWDGYGHRAKQAELNDGVDWKALSHALRAGYQMLDILSVGGFSYPLSQTAFLIDVKLGRCDYKKEVAPALERVVDRVEERALENRFDYPAKVDKKFWDQWLLSVYSRVYSIDNFTQLKL